MSTKLRVLFVGINYRYMNPTNTLLPALLARMGTAHLYGPGFVDRQTLSRGIAAYVDALGGVDLILTVSQLCGAYPIERIQRFVRRYTVYFGGDGLDNNFLADVEGYFRKNRERVVGLFMDVDPHGATSSQIDAFQTFAGYFVCWSEGFLKTLADPVAVAQEKYLQKKQKVNGQLDRYEKFLTENQKRVVNLGHFVADNEFHWGGLGNREFDAAVPGVPYARRAVAVAALRENSALRLAKLRAPITYRIANRLGLHPFANYYLLHLYNLAFQRAISQSRVCITDGGGNNYPVRKFLEIPAAGALLVCWPAAGMDLLGFREGNHFLAVRNEREVGDLAGEVARHPERFEHIATAGRELVFRSHSLSVRAGQLGEALHLIRMGNFAGSTWRDGYFMCHAAQETP